MYSIDINLLSERSEYRSNKQAGFTPGTTLTPRKYGKTPLYISAGITALSLMAIGGGWLWTNQQTAELEAKQQQLDKKLGSLKVQDARLATINTEITATKDESTALASIFNQIQPWSAVLQDMRESIPQGVQISNISQTEIKSAPVTTTAAPPPAPGSSALLNKISSVPNPEAKPATPGAPTPAPPTAATPATPATAGTPLATLPADVPVSKIEITGNAKSFDEVNNFMLTLKHSAFFNPDETLLMSATLIPSPAIAPAKQVLSVGQTPTIQEKTAYDKLSRLELPKVVEYKIQTSLKRIPANALIQELERKGAVGLVTRLRSLQQQQVIKP